MEVFSFRNLLNDLHSDGDDSDEFLPSAKELRSSSDEEPEQEEEDFCGGLDSDDEIVAKKSKRGAAAPRTPRSAQKTRASSRTPRKTPVKKVCWGLLPVSGSYLRTGGVQMGELCRSST